MLRVTNETENRYFRRVLVRAPLAGGILVLPIRRRCIVGRKARSLDLHVRARCSPKILASLYSSLSLSPVLLLTSTPPSASKRRRTLEADREAIVIMKAKLAEREAALSLERESVEATESEVRQMRRDTDADREGLAEARQACLERERGLAVMEARLKERATEMDEAEVGRGWIVKCMARSQESWCVLHDFFPRHDLLSLRFQLSRICFEAESRICLITLSVIIRGGPSIAGWIKRSERSSLKCYYVSVVVLPLHVSERVQSRMLRKEEELEDAQRLSEEARNDARNQTSEAKEALSEARLLREELEKSTDTLSSKEAKIKAAEEVLRVSRMKSFISRFLSIEMWIRGTLRLVIDYCGHSTNCMCFL